jgi:peptidoglycan/LPS O-acetylase OafA/YrhL
MEHRRQYDGIRALAIVLVLLCHSMPHAEGGASGVNIFFTLSGFLITGLLLAEQDRYGGVWLGGFYARRLLRLMPPLLVMLLLVALLPDVYGTARSGFEASLWIIIPASLFYVGNYFQAAGQPFGYLAHTWSLGVEEQFYLFWPIAMLSLERRHRLARALPKLIVLAVVLRAVLAGLGLGSHGLAIWLPSVADDLLIGALLSVWMREPGRLAWAERSTAGWGALAVLGAVCVFASYRAQGMQGTFALFGGITLVGAATAVLIAHLGQRDDGVLSWLFAWTPVVGVGRVSYGIYLYHYVIFQWVQHQHYPSQAKSYLLEYGITAVAVTASWFLVEQPALRFKERFRPSRAPFRAVGLDLGV